MTQTARIFLPQKQTKITRFLICLKSFIKAVEIFLNIYYNGYKVKKNDL